MSLGKKILVAALLLAFLVVAIREYSLYQMTNIQLDVATQIGNSMQQRTEQISSQVMVDAVFAAGDKVGVNVRNTGGAAIPANSVAAFVDDNPANSDGCQIELNVGAVCTLTIDTSFPASGVSKKITILSKGGTPVTYSCRGTGKNYC